VVQPRLLRFCLGSRFLLFGAFFSRLGRRLACLCLPGRGAMGHPSHLNQRVLLVLKRDLTSDVAIQAGPWRTSLERRPVQLVLCVLLQQALDPVPAQLRVLGYDLFAYADLEWPAILATEAMRI
jgi:hypothetical protein